MFFFLQISIIIKLCLGENWIEDTATLIVDFVVTSAFIAAGICARMLSIVNLRIVRSRFADYHRRCEHVLNELSNDPTFEELLTNLTSKLSSNVRCGRPVQFSRHMQKSNSRGSHSSRDILVASSTFWADLVKPSEDLNSSFSDEVLNQNMGEGPVTCLDQLMMQAELLAPFLRFKAQKWALGSRGMFESRAGDFISCVELCEDRCKEREPKLHHPKALARVAEKLFCSLRSDVSRVTDVCRQRIVFDSMADLCVCVDLILQDEKVSVEGFLDRMRPRPDGPPLYHRCLFLFVRVVTLDTFRLGLENHVCEVQLMLRPLAELQSPESHALYTAYKNAHDVRQGVKRALTLRTEKARYARHREVVARRSSCASVHSASHSDPAMPSVPSLTSTAERWLLAACLKAAVLPGDSLTSRMSVVHLAIARASFSSCLFTATPLAAALTKPGFRAFFHLLGAVMLSGFAFVITAYQGAGIDSARFLRFTALEFSDAGGAGGWRGPAEVGLLMDGCST
eukprot:CAMPEP_0113691314 /NCGR_PEP_ID=MMETSP0038_2-20120614/18355_1 /TAXON_ID=2898 /ORGANISM="Cryptomonas paramecium" /LENGTH=510 /DNA_ID=CAMNT_0000612891 /DNA_START=942 /DNA_END=2471 /DNA_ORIENTATION=+ /assembly_acc=CAM_ASM_000170